MTKLEDLTVPPGCSLPSEDDSEDDDWLVDDLPAPPARLKSQKKRYNAYRKNQFIVVTSFLMKSMLLIQTIWTRIWIRLFILILQMLLYHVQKLG